ncbi:MAG: hypothetical protein AAB019_00690, partial [Planctomycetota bacterium]
QVGESWLITYTYTGTISKVKFQYSVDGNPYQDIPGGTNINTGGDYTGQWTWAPIPDAISNNVLVKVLDNDPNHPVAQEGISAQCKIKGKLILDFPKGNEPEPQLPWSVGLTYPITWTAQGSIATVEIRYSAVITDTIDNTYVISSGVVSGAGTRVYNWTIPDTALALPSTNVKIWVINTADSTVLSKSTYFFRVKGMLQLINPPSPQLVNAPYTIQWQKSTGITQVKLEYWDDPASLWKPIGAWPIAAGAGGSGSYNWTIADAISPNAKLRITDYNDGTVSDESTIFRIKGSITVTNPTAFNEWVVGENRPISWSLNGTISLVNIYYSKNNFVTTGTIQANVSVTAGVYNWNPVTDDVTAGYNVKIKITNAADENNMQGESPAFKIKGTLNLTYPPTSDGDIFRVGNKVPIQWTSNANSISQVKLSYVIGGSPTLIQTVASVKGANSWDWTIPAGATSDNVRIRVEDANDNTVLSDGSKYFMVKPEVKMTSPGAAAGEVYKVGTGISINFVYTGTAPATMNFYYNKGAGDVYIGQKVDVVSGTNSFPWTIQDAALASSVIFKIKHPTDSDVTSNAVNSVKIIGDFTNIRLAKGVTDPISIVTVNDSGVTVKWTGVGPVPYVKIEYSNDGFILPANIWNMTP